MIPFSASPAVLQFSMSNTFPKQSRHRVNLVNLVTTSRDVSRAAVALGCVDSVHPGVGGTAEHGGSQL